MHLGSKFVPQLDGELAIGCAEGTNESILKRLNSSLGGVDSVVVWLNQLKCYLLRGEVSFDCFGGLVVHHIDFWFEPLAYQIFEIFCLCLQNSFRIKAHDWGDEYCIGFVMVHHEETYVSVQGHVWEISRAVVVYNARYFVCERTETKHVCD